MWIDKNGVESDHETPTSCAYTEGYKFYVKLDSYGFLYDPIGLFTKADDLEKRDSYKDKLLFNWFQTDGYAYEAYVDFLKTKSHTDLTRAQNIINNSVKVISSRTFKRSKK